MVFFARISDICAGRTGRGRDGVAALLELGCYASADHARGPEARRSSSGSLLSGRDRIPGWGGGEAVAAHYLTDRGQIRGAAGAGGEDVGDLAEIGPAEHGRARDRQERRVNVAVVLELLGRRGTNRCAA
jgi:hypothetical protein